MQSYATSGLVHQHFCPMLWYFQLVWQVWYQLLCHENKWKFLYYFYSNSIILFFKTHITALLFLWYVNQTDPILLIFKFQADILKCHICFQICLLKIHICLQLYVRVIFHFLDLSADPTCLSFKLIFIYI